MIWPRLAGPTFVDNDVGWLIPATIDAADAAKPRIDRIAKLGDHDEIFARSDAHLGLGLGIDDDAVRVPTSLQ